MNHIVWEFFNNSLIEKKTIIFDMDETLIHCVDDIETEDPMYVIQIQFPDEDLPVSVTQFSLKFLGGYKCASLHISVS